MANPSRTVFVDVFIKKISPLEFDVLPSPKNDPQLPTSLGSGKPGQPEIIFCNKGHAGFDIHFELQGNTHGYFFPSTAQKSDAVWSKCGSDCPVDAGVWEVFTPLRVVEPSPPSPPGTPVERRILIVKNLNPPATPTKPPQGKFKYNLRVVNKDGDWKNLDPGGDNTNGGWGRTSLSYQTVAAIAGTTAIFSAFATTVAFKLSNSMICPGVVGP